jgi:RNA binding exosome subunit
MMDDVIEIEVNLSAFNKTKQKNETKMVKEEEPQASPHNQI